MRREIEVPKRGLVFFWVDTTLTTLHPQFKPPTTNSNNDTTKPQPNANETLVNNFV